MNPALWLTRAARLYPSSPALIRGERVVADYSEFARRVASLAGALRHKFNVNVDDRVAICMSNSTEYLEILYAVWFAGAVAVPINAKLHSREIAWMIENSAATTIVGNTKILEPLATVLEAPDARLLNVEDPSYPELYDGAPLSSPVRRTADDLIWLFYTSGTTGNPKGVMITAANLQTMAMTYFIDVDHVVHEDATLYAAPMSHGAGLYTLMFTMRGARHVVPESGAFDADEIARLAPVLRNVCMFAAPTMVRRMITQAQATGYRGDGIKTIVYGGGPMYVADIIDAVAVFGPRFAQIYGQGESPMAITALSKELVADRDHPRWRERLGSVGTAQSSAQVIIADEAGQKLPCGEIGEILVSGTQVMSGYWRNEEATRNTLRDGWLWTGDKGVMDEDGFVTLHDRSKDVIISGGTNIYPREVEEALLTHASVSQVSVVGRPDPEWGEVVVAFVVLEPGHAADDAALDACCLERIARFKRPKSYHYLDDLPKNAYGKVLKTELRELLTNQ